MINDSIRHATKRYRPVPAINSEIRSCPITAAGLACTNGLAMTRFPLLARAADSRCSKDKLLYELRRKLLENL